jgi:hypothetical protein
MSPATQSFEQMLSKVMEGTLNGAFNPEAVHKQDREIERKMEEFDREKKQKAAKSEEELSRLVITA